MRQSTKTALTAAIALGLVAGISVDSANAYFTSYAIARGGHPIQLQDRVVTEIREEFSQWTKHISLVNTGDAECWVRVKVFAGSIYETVFSGSQHWSPGEDGYWYYDEILAPGGVTEILDVKIILPDGGVDEFGNKLSYKEDFNVVVVQECTSVRYGADGTPYADWNAVLDHNSDRYEWEEGGTGDA